ncbi:AtpZ/AtpI family protein [Chrysiogenes arsenatis]|uniref:AtpZ/AtpI family protein n=1 Tax=Chrysiogenes arsenatis TaxID=309797 RepID=UPI000413B5A2|nr:AtpZ/AtpI family protein [Chrysiogenes arsenatis]
MRQIANASSIGIAFILAFGIFVWLGYMVDIWFDWHPWGKIVGLIYGLIAGFRNVWIMAKRYGGMGDEPPTQDRKNDN